MARMRNFEDYTKLFNLIVNKQIQSKSIPNILEREDIFSMCYFGFLETDKKYPEGTLNKTDFRRLCYVIISRRLIDTYRQLFWIPKDTFKKIKKSKENIPAMFQEFETSTLNTVMDDPTNSYFDEDIIDILFQFKNEEVTEIMKSKFIKGVSLEKQDKVCAAEGMSPIRASRMYTRNIKEVRARADRYIEKLQ